MVGILFGYFNLGFYLPVSVFSSMRTGMALGYSAVYPFMK